MRRTSVYLEPETVKLLMALAALYDCRAKRGPTARQPSLNHLLNAIGRGELEVVKITKQAEQVPA